MKKIQAPEIKPKLIPFKCPVCSGWGTVNWGKAICHGCDGRGYILIDEERETAKNGSE